MNTLRRHALVDQYLTDHRFIVTTATMVLSALRDLAPDEMREHYSFSEALPLVRVPADSLLTVIYVLKRMFALIALPIEITVSAIYVR